MTVNDTMDNTVTHTHTRTHTHLQSGPGPPLTGPSGPIPKPPTCDGTRPFGESEVTTRIGFVPVAFLLEVVSGLLQTRSLRVPFKSP